MCDRQEIWSPTRTSSSYLRAGQAVTSPEGKTRLRRRTPARATATFRALVRIAPAWTRRRITRSSTTPQPWTGPWS
jgi:hypothetical protein